MTRDEHLKFCKKCTNRKMDMQQGLLCGITGRLADFEAECPDFNLDKQVKEVLNQEEDPEKFVLPHPEEVVKEIKDHQDLAFAISVV